MGKDNNLHDYLSDIADAIREKKNSTGPINAQDFSTEIRDISSSQWTGHADIEGLKAIGWDDEDIAYYQRYGVNWMEEDDEYHKVSEDNKALYGVLTADNIQEYKDRIVYLPKIDTSSKNSGLKLFQDCHNMVAIPLINTSSMRSMELMFAHCFHIVTIPPINTINTTEMASMFYNCYSLTSIPKLNTSKVVYASYIFSGCFSLPYIPQINTSKVKSIYYGFYNCTSLKRIENIDMVSATSISSMFTNCHSLEDVNLENINSSFQFPQSPILSKYSLLHIINKSSVAENIVITLQAKAYSRLSTDTDIIAALNNHPLISLASA